MPVGPQLPSPAGKRKRDAESSDNDSDSDDSLGPKPPPSKEIDDSLATKKQRVIGPSLPPSTGSNEIDPQVPKDDTSSVSSDDDDDFGPSLPTNTNAGAVSQHRKPATSVESQPKSATANEAPSTRDEWMTLAPASGDWSQRVDPTKLKNRKFNTGRSAGKQSSGVDAWHETPEQKQARLQREVLGIKEGKLQHTQQTPTTPSENDADTASRMKEYNAQRGPSLFDAHQKTHKVEKEDDPSARAFDREKDIGGGLQLNSTQRREMMKKSSDFNSRFSSAKYL